MRQRPSRSAAGKERKKPDDIVHRLSIMLPNGHRDFFLSSIISVANSTDGHEICTPTNRWALIYEQNTLKLFTENMKSWYISEI